MRLTTTNLRQQFTGGTVNWVIRRKSGGDSWYRATVTDIRLARNKPDRKLWLDISVESMERYRGPGDWVKSLPIPVIAPYAELVEMKSKPGDLSLAWNRTEPFDEDYADTLSENIILVPADAKPIRILVWPRYMKYGEVPVTLFETWVANKEDAEKDVDVKVSISPNGSVRLREILTHS